MESLTHKFLRCLSPASCHCGSCSAVASFLAMSFFQLHLEVCFESPHPCTVRTLRDHKVDCFQAVVHEVVLHWAPMSPSTISQSSLQLHRYSIVPRRYNSTLNLPQSSRSSSGVLMTSVADLGSDTVSPGPLRPLCHA